VLKSRNLLVLLGYTVLTFAGYGTLFAVVPLWTAHEGNSDFSAGASTGVFMGVTVLTQLCTPLAIRRCGHRVVLCAGALLLGLPVLLLPLSHGAAAILAVCAVRGIGFGLTTVSANALLGELVPSGRLGTAAGLYGIAIGLPLLTGLPLGVYVATNSGFLPVFLVAAILPCVAAPAALLLPSGSTRDAPPTQRSSVRTLLIPTAAMVTVSSASGAVISLLALAVAGAAGVVSVSLFMISLTMVVFRWLAGLIGDRIGKPGRLLIPGMLLCATGVVVLVLVLGVDGSTALVVVGAAVIGAGFGIVQNDALVVMFSSVGRGEYPAASAAWNIGYDAGSGVGAMVVGGLAGVLGYPFAFAVTAGIVVITTLPVALRLRR
jgi:MFS family permease